MTNLHRAKVCLAFVSTLFVVSLASSLCFADAPTAADHNEQGFAYFAEGEFEEAAKSFRTAHSTLPRAEFRKNEAIAWFKAEQCEEAVAAAQSYLTYADTPDADQGQARSIVANCKVRLAREALDTGSVKLAVTLLQEAEDLKPDDFTRDKISAVWVEIAQNQQLARDKNAQDQLGDEDREKMKEAQRGSRSNSDGSAAPTELALSTTDGQADATSTSGEVNARPIIGWSLAIAGTATLVGAIAYHLLTLSAQNELVEISENGGDADRYDSLKTQVDTARWLVPTLYGVGGALTGVGVWLIVPNGSEQSTSAEGGEQDRTWSVGLHFSGEF